MIPKNNPVRVELRMVINRRYSSIDMFGNKEKQKAAIP
jgi:hypothetical protein